MKFQAKFQVVFQAEIQATIILAIELHPARGGRTHDIQESHRRPGMRNKLVGQDSAKEWSQGCVNSHPRPGGRITQPNDSENCFAELGILGFELTYHNN